MPNVPPLFLLDSCWRIAKQIRNVPAWTGYIEVTRLEFDEETGHGVVHIVAQPGKVWELKLSLDSFARLIHAQAVTPLTETP